MKGRTSDVGPDLSPSLTVCSCLPCSAWTALGKAGIGGGAELVTVVGNVVIFEDLKEDYVRLL